MSHRFIIIAFTLLLLTSFSFLAWTEEKAKDPDRGKNWWALSFRDPKDKSLAFDIENHTADKTYFAYIVTRGDKVLYRDSLIISRGTTERVSLDGAQSLAKKRTTVTVWVDPEEKREIRK
jgi:hypothetical protein